MVESVAMGGEPFVLSVQKKLACKKEMQCRPL